MNKAIEATIYEKITLKEQTTAPIGTDIRIELVFKNSNGENLATFIAVTSVSMGDGKWNEISYSFVIKDVMYHINKDPYMVHDLLAGVDINHDNIISKREQTSIKVIPYEFLGIGYDAHKDHAYLVLPEDLKHKAKEYYKEHTPQNPVTGWIDENIDSEFGKGAASLAAGQWGFGDWVARFTGFRDWQNDSVILDNNEQEKAIDEFGYMVDFILYIVQNKNGSGEIFANAISKYIKQNPQYISGRLLTGIGLAKIVTPKGASLKKSIAISGGISGTGLMGDRLFTARQIDEFARGIILGK
jgi:hypothetical protein